MKNKNIKQFVLIILGSIITISLLIYSINQITNTPK